MKCVFFDRDGIINRSPGPGYVERWEEFHIESGFIEALKVADGLGYVAIMISNQQCVGKGIVDKEYLEWMHEKLQTCLMDVCGIKLFDIYYCPHLANAGCLCRKPLPGMILAAAKKHNIYLEQSFMVGDKEGDVVAGKSAGCTTILVSDVISESEADYRVDSMDELPKLMKEILSED